MSEYTLAVFGTLEQGQADFQQTYNSLVSEVQMLEAQLRSSLTQWVGSAQQAYYQQQAQWNAAMAHMEQVLAQLLFQQVFQLVLLQVQLLVLVLYLKIDQFCLGLSLTYVSLLWNVVTAFFRKRRIEYEKLYVLRSF